MNLDQQVALNAIKGQVSTLAIFFQRLLAFHSLVKTFLFTGCLPYGSPVCSLTTPRDLNLVLLAIQKLFELIRYMSTGDEPIGSSPVDIYLISSKSFWIAKSTKFKSRGVVREHTGEPYGRHPVNKKVLTKEWKANSLWKKIASVETWPLMAFRATCWSRFICKKVKFTKRVRRFRGEKKSESGCANSMHPREHPLLLQKNLCSLKQFYPVC